MTTNDDALQLLGLKVHPFTMEQSIQRCEDLIKLRGKQHVVINAAKVVAADESKELQALISSCDLINADGMSIVWASRLLGAPVPERVAGIDLMYSLVEMSRDKNYSIHLLGASESVSLQVAKTFSDYGANVIGRRNGYWEIEEEESIVQEVASLAPDILFVAIPSPKKEYFLREHLESLNCGLVMGVGGSFDVVAGVTKRAPKLLQMTGLEWFYRLSQEPRRMLKRYAVGNTKFIILVIRSLASKKHHRKNVEDANSKN